MKYTLKNVTFSALATLLFVVSAFCMEAESKILTPVEKSTQLLPFLFSIDFCDHFMICKMNRLNKKFYETIKQTASGRRQHIEKNMQLKPSDPLQQIVWWHPCGSSYGFIEPKNQSGFGLTTYWVEVNQIYLGYNKEIKSMNLISEPTVVSSISCFKRGKCDENGAMNFYYIGGYGNSEVRELSCFSDKRCAVSFSDSSGFCGSLYTLVSLPKLFWAFIHSSLVYNDHRDPTNYKIFDLKGVTIPMGFDEAPSFEELPPNWKKAIADRYAEQQSKK